MDAYSIFNVANTGTLFRTGALELERVMSNQPNVILGRVVVCADKLRNLAKKTQKEFETTIDPALRAQLREQVAHRLNMRIRNDAHLWEILNAAAKKMNDSQRAPNDDCRRAVKIFECMADMFPDQVFA